MPEHDYFPLAYADPDRLTQLWYGPDAHGPVPSRARCTCEYLDGRVRVTNVDCAVHCEPEVRLADAAYDWDDPGDRVERPRHAGRRSERGEGT